MDNLPSRMREVVKEKIEPAEATLCVLPTHSTDFNLTEKALQRLNAML